MDKKYRLFVAIDLGTTNITCTLLKEYLNGVLTKEKLRIRQLIDMDGEMPVYGEAETLPAVVWLKDDQVFTGSYCKSHIHLLAAQPNSVVVKSIKSEIASDDWAVLVGGQLLSPLDIYYFLLKTIYPCLAAHLAEGYLESVVITIPASFSSKMRRNTILAARALWQKRAVSLLDEPIAAIFSDWDLEGMKFRSIPFNEPVMIVDPGGGTTDVAVVKIADNQVEILGSSRYNDIAGDDLDLEIAALLLHHIRQQPDYNGWFDVEEENIQRGRVFELISFAERVKKGLNGNLPERFGSGIADLIQKFRLENKEFNLSLAYLFEGLLPNSISIPYAEILSVLEKYLSRKSFEAEKQTHPKSAPRNIFSPIEQALQDAELEKYDIVELYATGGSCQFRPFLFELKAAFSDVKLLDPDFSVSEGAAVFNYLTTRHKWVVKERTHEKIFLKRSGLPFLEIMGGNQPIPSGKIILRKESELHNNNTLELVETTDSLRFEFYSGTSDDDLNITYVHDEEIRLDRYLEAGATITEIQGWIDKDKVFNFAFTFTEPTGGEYTVEIDFSADETTGQHSPKKTTVRSLKLNELPI